MRRLKTSVPVVLVTGVLAAAPAAAGAPPPPPSQVRLIRVATGPITANLAGHRYSLRLMAMRSLRSGTTVTVTFTRTVGTSTQSHLYAFELGRRALSCTGRRLRCRLDTGRSLGRYGRVRLAVTATRRPRAVAVEPGCTGSATRDAAVARLTLRFLDRSASLNVVSSGRRSASIRRVRGTCSGFVPCHRQVLGLQGADPAAAFVLDAPSNGAAVVDVAFTDRLRIAHAYVSRWIRVRNLSTTRFTIAPDLSTATFDADGLPFLSGSIAYTASQATRQFPNACGQPEATLGSVTGDVAALFDGIGRRPLTATGGYLQKIP